jgi:hypothetical protein
VTSAAPDESDGHLAEREGEAPPGLELAPRPRRRLIAPVPLSLLAVVLVAAGFIAGARVEKGRSASGAGTGAFAGASRSAALGASAPTAGKGSSATPTSAGQSAGPATEVARPTSGKVTSKSGKTLYVKGSEGSTVKVATSAATTVTKTVKAKVKAIHPGETVTITGSTGSKGSVTAESISVGSGAVGGGSLGAG